MRQTKYQETSSLRFILILALTTFSLIPSASANSCGRFVAAKGNAEFKKNSQSTWTKVKIGGKVCEGAWLKTGESSHIKIRMLDKNVLSLSASSQFHLAEYENKPESKKVSLNLLYGLLRSTVNEKYLRKEDHFEVKTKTIVAGVRGTDFLTEFNPKEKKSVVTSFEGVLSIRNFDRNGRLGSSVKLRPGFSITAASQKPLTKPAKVPAKRMKRLDRETKLKDLKAPLREKPEMRPLELEEKEDRKENRREEQSRSQRQREDNPRRRFKGFDDFKKETGEKKRTSEREGERPPRLQQQREMINQQNQRVQQRPPLQEQRRQPPPSQQQPQQPPPPPPPPKKQ